MSAHIVRYIKKSSCGSFERIVGNPHERTHCTQNMFQFENYECSCLLLLGLVDGGSFHCVAERGPPA